mgnify:CR=1 FL=1
MHSILAVDDSASMRQMVSFTLKNAGFNVVEAVDGQDAWEKAGQRDFNLVLTDQIMPGMTGVELLDLVHPAGPPCQASSCQASPRCPRRASCRRSVSPSRPTNSRTASPKY